jgi:hypothetical protein
MLLQRYGPSIGSRKLYLCLYIRKCVPQCYVCTYVHHVHVYEVDPYFVEPTRYERYAISLT